ncbi:thioredoxin domain-containing protein [Kitasatospora sp. NPDC098663]|uniref:thioredoxin domain-containing protein n=1 Tax=Kitasatospora sp. NPDC098663 TaxID=3364096 RepID=UPI003814EE3B
MSYNEPQTAEEFDKLLANPQVAVMFHAEWAGPSLQIAPIFKQQADNYPDATFCKVDIDKLDTHPLVKKVRSAPAFSFYLNRSLVVNFPGGSSDTLEQTLKAHFS